MKRLLRLRVFDLTAVATGSAAVDDATQSSRVAADAATITMVVGVTNVNTTTATTRWDANRDGSVPSIGVKARHPF